MLLVFLTDYADNTGDECQKKSPPPTDGCSPQAELKSKLSQEVIGITFTNRENASNLLSDSK